MSGILESGRTPPVQASLEGPVSEIFPSLYCWMQVMGSAPPVKPLFRKTSVVPLTTNSPSAFTEESLYRAPNFCSKRALSAAVAEAAIVSITRNGTKRDIEVLRISTTLLGPTSFLARRFWIIQKHGRSRYQRPRGNCSKAAALD